MAESVPVTLDDLKRELNPIKESMARLEVYTKGIMLRLLSPTEIAQIDAEIASTNPTPAFAED